VQQVQVHDPVEGGGRMNMVSFKPTCTHLREGSAYHEWVTTIKAAGLPPLSKPPCEATPWWTDTGVWEWQWAMEFKDPGSPAPQVQDLCNQT
jgi:hypothetical protein